MKTIESDAKEDKDYKPIDEVITIPAGQTKTVKIEIIDDDDWNPDREFKIVLLDVNTQEQLKGKDTQTVVTIIDDDKPGNIYFEESKGAGC